MFWFDALKMYLNYNKVLMMSLKMFASAFGARISQTNSCFSGALSTYSNSNSYSFIHQYQILVHRKESGAKQGIKSSVRHKR